MRTLIVSLVPSCTGDGERDTMLTFGKDKVLSWACVLRSNAKLVKAR